MQRTLVTHAVVWGASRARMTSNGKRKLDHPSVRPVTIRRLQNELRKAPTDTLKSGGMYTLEVNDVDMTRWVVNYRYDTLDADATPTQQRIRDELATLDLTSLRVIFKCSEDFPDKPPLVYIETPRLSGRWIDGPSGAFCHEVLHPKHGWRSDMLLTTLIVAIRGMLDDPENNLRIFGATSHAHAVSSEEDARKIADFFEACHKQGY